jgi:hypothetical protein
MAVIERFEPRRATICHPILGESRPGVTLRGASIFGVSAWLNSGTALERRSLFLESRGQL